jgi:glutathione synthase/RimK-type ligase-like ATP-grasp enzyme
MVKVINERFSKYSHLVKVEEIAPFLPETALLNAQSFKDYTDKYVQVLLRPCHDFKINILVTSLDENQYLIETGNKKKIINGKQEAYQYLNNNLLDGKRFIIQQSIPRAQLEEKDFEVRVYAAKVSSIWSITEKIARITPNGYSFVDEVVEIFPVSSVLPKALFDRGISSILDDISLKAAINLEEKYPNYNTVILDFFFDQLGKPWVNEIRFRFSDGKWDWHQVLRGERDLYPYLPETYLYHEKVLPQYLEVYNSCVIKPNLSQWGLGIALISKLEDQTFEIHSERNKIPFTTIKEMLLTIEDRFTSKKSYLIQEEIPLATINDCPFDIRVMIQRKTVNSPWVVTGKMTRIAAKGFIVTNVAKAISTVEDALEASSINNKNVDALLWEIDQIGIMAAKQLEKVYPDACLWGMDIGIDQYGKPWFIEANLVPDIAIFRYLPDKTMYKRIRKYIREGRKKSEGQ